MELKTIKELYEKVKSGEIDESKLVVVLDGYQVSIYTEEGEDIRIKEDMDLKSLCKFLFPNAQIEWC